EIKTKQETFRPWRASQSRAKTRTKTRGAAERCSTRRQREPTEGRPPARLPARPPAPAQAARPAQAGAGRPRLSRPAGKQSAASAGTLETAGHGGSRPRLHDAPGARDLGAPLQPLIAVPSSLSSTPPSCPDLIRASMPFLLSSLRRKWTDCRVKPGNDERSVGEKRLRRLLGGGSSLSRFSSGLERDRLAAAAGAGLVRIVEHEARAHPVGAIVHFGTEQEHDGRRVDQEHDPLGLDALVVRPARSRIFHGVFHAGAAAVLDPDADAFDLLARPGSQRANTLGGGLGQAHHSRAGTGGHGQKLG